MRRKKRKDMARKSCLTGITQLCNFPGSFPFSSTGEINTTHTHTLERYTHTHRALFSISVLTICCRTNTHRRKQQQKKERGFLDESKMDLVIWSDISNFVLVLKKKNPHEKKKLLSQMELHPVDPLRIKWRI